ncbi:retrovirus-related pol polyprotein from transposon TNT 1-94 [Tanacetum coccineum]
MNMGQDRQMQMVEGNGGNQFRQYAGQNVGNQVVQNVGNQNGLIVVPGIANQNTNVNGNVVAARAEGNANGNNGNQIRCHDCRGLGHFARNYTVKPRRRDAAYLQTQLLIAQKEEAGIQLQAEEYDLMAAAADLDEIEEVNANCILMANLQQASTSGTQTDKAPIYDSNGSAEVHNYDNCYDNEIFNMFTQEEQYTELLEPIPEPRQVQQNDSNVISAVSSVEQSGGTVEQHPANIEETRVLYDSLYNNLAIEVEKVNTVNRKLKETNADLTTELARYKNQEKCFEISQEKYDKLERCYQKSVYQEQCLTKKINALHLSSEKKKLNSDFKIREDELLDKQIQLENKIMELDNILVKTGQSIQTMHMLSPKPDSFYHTEQKMALGYQNPFYLKQAQQKQQSLYNGKVLLEKHDPPAVYNSEETLQLAQESRQKMKQLNKEIKPANYTKINHLSGVFVSQMAKSREESYFTNASKTATVSKSISIPNEFSDDATPSVARKFLNEKTLELEIERLLREVVSQDIMSIVQNPSVVDTSNLQTDLDCTKERFENCIIKKENEYAKLWNDWYKKCEECKYDKISYDKAYNDMQQKIERLQAQLGDLKGKSNDTSCVSDTLDPLSQKLENENVKLEFQDVNYVREIEHLKTTYKNLFDSISLRAQLFDKASEQTNTANGTSANTKFANQSILGRPFLPPLRNNFVVRQPNAFQSERLKFSKNWVPQKVDKTNDLSNPVTSNLVPTLQESKVVKNDNVIAPGMFRINPSKTSKEEKFVPVNKVRASIRTNPITVSQPHVITKKDVNSDSNGLSSTGVDNTTKTRRSQPRSNTKNDRVPSASKSRCIKNKEVEVEEHHRNLMLSKNKKHMLSECNNVKLAIRNDKYEIVCAMCKQCLITANHDVCVLNYVNDMNSRGKKQKPNVSNTENQKKQKPQVWKPKKVGSKERLASPKPSKPRICLRWSPTGRLFDLKGKIITSSESESQSDCSNGYPNLFMFLGTVRFGNDHVAAILGFDDLQWGNILITRVYFVEGLGHNLLSVRQFCDSDLEEKSKRASHPPKPVPNSKQRLHLLHMDLCGPMRIAIINRKRYVLVIVDDYSRYTWVHFLSSKDEAPKVIKMFLKRITVLLQSPVIIIRTDNDTEFKNQILKEYFDSVGISHQTSSVRTPQQNRVVERRNRTLVEAARTMLIFSRAPLFLWAEAIATAKPNISFLHVFGALCYPKNDREDIGKLGAKGDIGFFIGYSADSCAYRVYNRRTKKIMETMNVTFDELSAMAFEQSSSKPGLQSMTSGQISSGLDLTYAPSTITTQQPTEGELDLLFEAMYDDHIGGQPSAAPRTVSAAQAPQVLQTPTATTTTADTAPTPTNSSSQATNFPNTSQDVDEFETQQQHIQQQDNEAPLQPETVADNVPNAMLDGNLLANPFPTPSTSAAESASSQYVDPSNMHTFYQRYPHEYQWTKDHPLEQVIGEPSRPVLTRNQLRSDGDMYALTVNTMEPKNVKEAMTDPAWIESMQEELLQFKRLDVWVLVPPPDNIKPLTLKWLFKNKHDEENTVIRNKTRLVVRGYHQEEGIDFENPSFRLLEWNLS